MSGIPRQVTHRVPLQDFSNIEPMPNIDPSHNASLAAPFNLSETPNSSLLKHPMRTPPDGYFKGAYSALIQHMLFSTPKQDASLGSWANAPGHAHIAGHQSLRALLSPAFSSPRHTAVKNAYYDTKHAVTVSPPACIDPSSSLLLNSSDDNHDSRSQITTKLTKKQSKRSKREEREHAFDLLSDEKPPYSYATLIGISILSHPDKQLPLSQIYQWISETFRYYKREDVGWQNSIRHNLSLNKAFVKGEKSKDGKGHFWCIKPGHEEQFHKARSIRQSSYTEVMQQITSAAKKRELEKLTSTRINIPSSPPALSVIGGSSLEMEEHIGGVLGCFSESHDEESYPYLHHEPDRDDTLELGNPAKRHKANADCHANALAVHAVTPIQGIGLGQDLSPALAGKRLTYTSSFTCDLNLELSPLRSCDMGPLLQPMTPANNALLREFHEPQSLRLPLLKPVSSAQSTPLPSINSVWVTPLLANLLGMPHSQGQLKGSAVSPFHRTPRDSTVRKLWHSPSYLEEFYYSPLNNTTSTNGAGTDVGSSPLASSVSLRDLARSDETHDIRHSHRGVFNSYDDDDMVVRSFENHPQEHRTPIKRSVCDEPRVARSKSVMEELKRMESGTPSPPTDIDK